MVGTGPLIVVLVGLGIAHLLVFLVRVRRGSAADGGHSGEGRVEELFDAGPALDAPERDLSDVVTMPCPECHAINDAGYTFCRHCLARLSA